MRIYVNDQALDLTSENLLLHSLQLSGVYAEAGIAVAVNNTIIPRSDWENYALNPDDKVAVFRAVQGG